MDSVGVYPISFCGYFQTRIGKQMMEFPFCKHRNFFHHLGEYVSSPVSSRYIGFYPLDNKVIQSRKTHERPSVVFHVYNKCLICFHVVLEKNCVFLRSQLVSTPTKVTNYWFMTWNNSNFETKLDWGFCTEEWTFYVTPACAMRYFEWQILSKVLILD